MHDALVEDAAKLAERAGRRGRVALGLVGAPGAGKSTLAEALVTGVNRLLGPDTAACLPMDGFHLSDRQLARIGRAHRKGAPDTFDAHGYLALLRRLLARPDHPVYVPDYDRELHEPVAARLVVHPGVRLLVTEGNYLAWDEPPWCGVRELLAETWYVEVPDATREARLLERQIAGGLDRDRARAWVASSDRPNGEVVKATRGNCTRVVRPG